MTTKRISAFPDQVDLQGLPAARLRALLLALASPEAAEIFDAQLADLHAEWLAVRERSRLRAAWLGLGIRAQLLTCAVYYAAMSLGVPALRNTAIFAAAAYITLGLFFALSTMIAPSGLRGERIEPRRIEFTMQTPPEPPKPDDFPRKPERPVTPVPLPPGDLVDFEGPNVRDGRGLLPRGHGHGGDFISGPPPAVPPERMEFDNFLCLPMVRSEPDYPTSAIRRRIEGNVLVDVSIDRSGSVSHAAVVQADPAGVFDDAVLRAVRRWRYRVSGDGPSCERTRVLLRFELPN